MHLTTQFKRLLCLAYLMITAGSDGTSLLSAAETRSLAERLGYKSGDKLLIVNGDDAGMCHSANVAVMEAMEKGMLRSATIMVPCPWFPEIAAYAKANPASDFGVHLCHTSEWVRYRWGSVAERNEVKRLLDPDGYLWREVMQVYTNGSPEQAVIEGRAQIKRALDHGVDVTHLDSHMGTMQLHPDYIKGYLQLAVEFNLPVRMASQETLARKGFPNLRTEFSTRGIVFPDYFVYEELADESKNVKDFWLRIVRGLKPGVTELYIHPAVLTDELKAITGTASIRAQEFEVFTKDPDMRAAIAENGVKLIGYKPLRDLQRSKK